MKQTVLSYGRAVALVAATVFIFVIAAHFLNRNKPPFLTDTFVQWMRVTTASLFAAATLGRCGWNIQTWAGNSPAELWNLKAFRSLYLAGFGLLVFSFLVDHV